MGMKGMADARVSEKKRIKAALRSERVRLAKSMKLLYLAILPAVVLLVIFNYIPMYGVIIAFKNYSPAMGALKSPWNNLYYFKLLFTQFHSVRVIRNTIIISLYKIFFGFPAPILFALLLNELTSTGFKKIVQSMSYLPHFLSWVVVASVFTEIVSPQRGIVGVIASLLNRDPPLLLTDVRLFRPFLVMTDIWKSVGWGSVVYLAAISAIDPSLYEVARIDGANRFRQAVHITIPSLIAVIVIMFILRLGALMNAGFDQIMNLYNPMVYEVGDIIDTYVYRMGIEQGKYAFSTTVGLFKNAVGLVLVLGSNLIVRRFSEYGLW